MIDRAQMEAHYQGILDRNEEKILAGGSVDPRLMDAAADNRMAMVLLIRIGGEVRNRIAQVTKELQKMEPGLYVYPETDYHITVMDLLKGEEGRELPAHLETYEKCISRCVGEIEPFWINFDGLTMSDGAVMVRGFYEEELQMLRESLRKSLREEGLELQERYETISSHITIARVKEKIADPEKLLAYVKEPHHFGILQVPEIELSFHNWYDTKKACIEKYDLQV